MQTNHVTYSATMLQDYLDCHRRYQYRYIQEQSWPAAISEPIQEYEEHLLRGQQFHHLVHQYFSGVPLNILHEIHNEIKVKDWFERFITYIENFKFLKSFSEIRLHSTIAENKIAAVYDLIAIPENDGVIIFDWKTSKKEPRAGDLLSRIQTSLYPFILWNNVDELIQPLQIESINQLKMVYWFTEFPDRPKSFIYDAQKHSQKREYLSSIISEIMTNGENNEFTLTENRRLCNYCQYRSLCARGIEAGNIFDDQDMQDMDFEFSIGMNDIDEIGPDI